MTLSRGPRLRPKSVLKRRCFRRSWKRWPVFTSHSVLPSLDASFFDLRNHSRHVVDFRGRASFRSSRPLP